MYRGSWRGKWCAAAVVAMLALTGAHAQAQESGTVQGTVTLIGDAGPVHGALVLVVGTGATAVLHDVATDGLMNVIANTASGVDVRQDLEATITLNDIGNLQSNVRLERLRMELGRP